MNGGAKKSQVRNRLLELELASSGRLTVDAIVEDAASPDSPLHGEFEWDDTTAARKYRKVQAGALMRRVRLDVVTKERTLRVPEYLRDPDAGTREQGYIRPVTLKTDREKALEALTSAAERAAAVLNRVRDLAAALDLADELDDLLAQFDKYRTGLDDAA